MPDAHLPDWHTSALRMVFTIPSNGPDESRTKIHHP